MIRKIIDFYKNLWNISLKSFSPKKAFLIKQTRILSIAFKGFVEDKVQLRASALTFYSLLSIVPILAMVFAIAKGFGYDETLKQQLTENFGNQDVVINNIITFAEKLLGNTNESYVAGVGAIVLLWSVMKVMGHIERSFNDIWEIKKTRNFFRKFSDYLAMMFVAPILFFGSLSYKISFLNTIAKGNDQHWIFSVLNQSLTIVILCVLFSLVYIIMPNTKVKYKNGLIAGVIAGILFGVLEIFFIKAQVSLFSDTYTAIYGAFAALPLFLLWMQYSWLIVLFGAEISFAHQNVENYEYETGALNISSFYKRVLSILVLHKIIYNFEKGEKPQTSHDIAVELDIPVRLVRDIIFLLKNSGLVNETTTNSPKELAYQPASDINKMDIKCVHERLEKYGFDELDIQKTPVLEKILEIQTAFINNIEKSSLNKLLKDI